MAGNPLTNPNWAAEIADTVERLVGTVRERATTPAVYAARALVYGVIAAFIGGALCTMLLIGFTGLQSLLDLAVSHDRAVYLSYLIVGGILGLAGWLILRKRRAPEA